ncbi:MAG: YvrJ family protein [Succiniclasticum sp.]|nr:YvrJ family protein [Succiniclasticum sp.]MCI6222700.1 YvrJ family protein [Selenomonadales bacterium]MDY2869411.1 YvrJ family protein [Succiniclasticum sp.]MDY6346665.1 YvrJ family protein [Succiniclasticum sp.]
MDTEQLLRGIADVGFPIILSWYLLVRMESKLAGLTEVLRELSVNVAALRQ